MSLYLPSKPYTYQYSRKFDIGDVFILSFLMGTIATMVLLAIADAFMGIAITGFLITCVVVSSCLTVMSVLFLIELVYWSCWRKRKYDRELEWEKKCKALTLDWNRDKSLKFVKEVRKL